MKAVVPATSHPAFEHRRSHRVETLDLTVHEFEHRRTGAMHYHLETAHDENVFMVALRTVPMNSTGVAHILEHTALCGSERFPVRDPFFWMIRRSLNTFMNAFTTSDYTAYPFASQNRKDFHNLLDVYLDAVFFSRLDPLDFAQEGHRLEFEAPDDPASDLVYRGVVYNEMKGDSSSPVSTLYEALKAHMYPTTTYHYNSGGDPASIPELSYDELLAFYKSHYHPSNAIFMTFGNIPAAELQQEFEDKALARFERLDAEIGVGFERRYKEPVTFEAPYDAEDGETDGKTHIVIGWLLGENTDLEMLLKCNLLSDALLDTSASPLRHALETSPYADAISPLSGLEETTHEMSFVCGVEGSEREHAAAIEALVMDTLAQVADNGIAIDKLEACLHQLELSQREIGGDGAPFGLQLIFSCMSAAIHRGDPIDLLDLEPVLEKLREDIRDPGFIPGLVRELLLDNPHRVRLTLYPQPGYQDLVDEREREKLRNIKDSLASTDVENIVALASSLAERQDAEENVDVLPRVGIEDVPLSTVMPEGERVARSGIPVTRFPAGTNGLVYQQVITQLPALAPELLELLPLYTNLVSELGSAGRDYLLTQHLQHSLTGGISAYSALRGEAGDPDQFRSFMTMSSRTLAPKAEAMMALLRDTALAPGLDDVGRVKDLVRQLRLRRESSVTGNGHSYAMSAASRGLRPVPALNHRLTGLAGIVRLKEIDDDLRQDGADAFVERLLTLHGHLMTARRELLVVSEHTNLDEITDQLAACWRDDAASEGGDLLTFPVCSASDQAWITTTQVNFCAKSFPTVAESDPDSAALSVLGGVLRNTFLHKAVREQGGAYGGSATHDSANGVFRFYSYRDPNLLRTFEAFDRSVRWIVDTKLDFSLVEESILGIVSSLDAPASPAGQARQAFHNNLFGRGADHRNHVRANLLAVTVDDIKRVTEQYLLTGGAQAIVTNESGARAVEDTFEIEHI